MSLQTADPPAEPPRKLGMTSTQLLQGLREHLRDPSAQFKSKAQEELVASVVLGRHTIGVLPTGSGKSMAFELACRLSKRSTIVAVPFRLLASQVYQTAVDRGLPVERWEVKTYRDVSKVKLIIVAYETLITHGFIE